MWFIRGIAALIATITLALILAVIVWFIGLFLFYGGDTPDDANPMVLFVLFVVFAIPIALTLQRWVNRDLKK